MMKSQEEIFNEALSIKSQRERDEYLDRACGSDTELRSRVAKQLELHAQAGSLPASPSSGLDATVDSAPIGDSKVAPEVHETGLASAFEPNQLTIAGDANQSVLKSLGKKLLTVPSVTLRVSSDEGPEENSSSQRPASDDNHDGRYLLSSEIARGGMGVIIKGRDKDLGRDLAIKVLLDSLKDKPDVIGRFVEEAQIGGQLQHPGIVPVYELGQFSDDRPFFSMKLVKGETLASLLAKRSDPDQDQAKMLGIFEQVCQTMAYAHSRGVIHRDLKPANIMVGAFGEVQVMDWGLAKVLSKGGIADKDRSQDQHRDVSVIRTRRSEGSDSPDSSGSLTHMGSVMGTPAYMPPEQALGEVDRLDERADVFGLGAILCEILTGRPPYVGKDGTEVFRRATRGKLDDCYARLKESKADEELTALCEKALAPEQEDRWHDAAELAASVSSYLNGVQERLKRAELESARSAAKRKMYVAVALLTLVIAVGTGIAAIQFRQEREQQTLLAKEKEVLAEKAKNDRDLALELLGDLREQLEEKVFLAIMAGDEEKAQNSIRQAQSAGVSEQQLTFYRGLLAMYYGRVDEAVKLLEPVSDESIAARGALAMAASYNLDFALEQRTLDKLAEQLKSDRTQLSFEDKLFAGWSMINGDMVEGMGLVRQATEERTDSPLAQVARAVTLAAFAHNTGSKDAISEAIEESREAMRWVGDTPILLITHHMVQYVSATFGADEAAEVGVDLDQLRAEWDLVKGVPMGRLMLVRLLAHLRDPSLAEFIHNQPDLLDDELAYYLPILLEYESPADVLSFSDQYLDRLGGEGEFARARVLALIPDRRSEAIELNERLTKLHLLFTERNYGLLTLLMLGERSRAESLASELLDTSVAGQWYQQEVQEFVATGAGDPNEFIENAGDVVVLRTEANFAVAMTSLMQEDPEQTVEYFTACLEGHAGHSPNYWWARAMLRALNGELNWSIPASETAR